MKFILLKTEMMAQTSPLVGGVWIEIYKWVAIYYSHGVTPRRRGVD